LEYNTRTMVFTDVPDKKFCFRYIFSWKEKKTITFLSVPHEQSELRSRLIFYTLNKVELRLSTFYILSEKQDIALRRFIYVFWVSQKMVYEQTVKKLPENSFIRCWILWEGTDLIVAYYSFRLPVFVIYHFP